MTSLPPARELGPQRDTLPSTPTNAFCVDLEEWFHVCGIETSYSAVSTWASAPKRVEANTTRLLEILAEAKASATFLTLGWIAEMYPDLVRRIADQGHEIGCHGYYHRLVYEQSSEEFRTEVRDARNLLQDITGQPVTCFRAPSFSIRADCLWAYEVLASEGFNVDVSVVPAKRSNGGIEGHTRAPTELHTQSGTIQIFPMSVMTILGQTTQFSGGGYLRLFPMSLVNYGFRQNHQLGLPVMTYIHPRDIDPNDPKLSLPLTRQFRHRVGLRHCAEKLRSLLANYQFSTVETALRDYNTASSSP